MIKEIEEVKRAIYVGMSIFNVLKNSIVKINKEIVSLEDKKYISLYLGLINSENKISYEFNDLFSQYNINYEILDMGSYMELYIEYFIKIFESIDFNSIDNYFYYLLGKEIVKKVNADNSLCEENIGNKKLIKKIK